MEEVGLIAPAEAVSVLMPCFSGIQDIRAKSLVQRVYLNSSFHYYCWETWVNRLDIDWLRPLEQFNSSDVGNPGIMRSLSFVLGSLSLLAVLISIFFNPQAGILILSSVSTCLKNTVCSSEPLLSDCPHSPSWSSRPERLTSTLSLARFQEWSILHHLGGNGPWIQKFTPDIPDISTPEHCSVEQVHLLSRHSERYPTKTAGKRHLDLVKRLKELDVPLNGSLAFVNKWTYFTQDAQQDFDQLTSTGPYAGTLGSFTTGTLFRTRYGHLLPRNRKTKIWASDSQRVIDTAKHFAAGLFGIDWEKDGKAEVQVIPETLDQHTDTLTPGDTCENFIEDTVLGHEYGKNMLAAFQNAYIPSIAKRLLYEEGNIALESFSNLEVYSMQEMCGFETIVRGSSPWCDVFTIEDWDHFEYARDILHYYRAGPGNKYAAVMGLLWLHATGQLLKAGPKEGTMFFSFVHDGDIAPVLTALDLFRDAKYDPNLPVTHIAKDRKWRVSTVMPMGGRLTLERLQCTSKSSEEAFVRININDGIIPLPDCDSGPGKSCPQDQFLKRIHDKKVQVGDFVDVCGTSGIDTGITFLRQPDK